MGCEDNKRRVGFAINVSSDYYNKNQGKTGEEAASKFLQKKGYRILERNFKIRYGEIDIIALESPSKLEKSSTLVFVEVKTRTSQEFGSPLEAITYWKLQSVVKTAQFYTLTHPKLPKLQRIDAVSVELLQDGSVAKIEHIENISGF